MEQEHDERRATSVVVYSVNGRAAKNLLGTIVEAIRIEDPGAILSARYTAGDERVELRNGVTLRLATPARHNGMRGRTIDLLLTDTHAIDDDTRLATETFGGRIVFMEPMRDVTRELVTH